MLTVSVVLGGEVSVSQRWVSSEMLQGNSYGVFLARMTWWFCEERSILRLKKGGLKDVMLVF